MPKAKAAHRAVCIVGPGRLGAAVATNLRNEGWKVTGLVVGPRRKVSERVRKLAAAVNTSITRLGEEPLASGLVWITVPDNSIEDVAAKLAAQQPWKGRVVFHSSGALTSDALQALRAKGASVASVHPGMTFVHGSVPDLRDVPFGIEGDPGALRLARQIIRELGGMAVTIRKENKVLYHAFDAFASPILIALMAALEDVGMAAGIGRTAVSSMAGPLLQKTLNNYLEHGAAAAFSGPFIRGDDAVIERHLDALRELPHAQEVYKALARVAVKKLPVKNRNRIKAVVR
jgi:predicted short-subunit dehydrogenase-like oxidoreductase (DUF2520 family)